MYSNYISYLNNHMHMIVLFLLKTKFICVAPVTSVPCLIAPLLSYLWRCLSFLSIIHSSNYNLVQYISNLHKGIVKTYINIFIFDDVYKFTPLWAILLQSRFYTKVGGNTILPPFSFSRNIVNAVQIPSSQIHSTNLQ